MFVSASLMLTFITLTAALLRTLQWVRMLADCTDDDSQCLHDLQRWFYTRLVQGLVKVDIQTLELQFSGACNVFTQDHTTASQLQGALASNVFTSEVSLPSLFYSVLLYVRVLLVSRYVFRYQCSSLLLGRKVLTSGLSCP